MTDRDPSQVDPHTLWVASSPAADGSYVVEFTLGDRAWVLTPAEVWRYVRAVLEEAARTDYDAAVIRQLIAIGVPAQDAAMTVAKDLRPRRPPVTFAGPLRLRGGVSSDGEFRPFLTVLLDGEPIGQWDPQTARDNASGALDVLHAVDLDQAYYAVLLEMGLGEDRSRAVVSDLARHRHD